MSKLNRHIAEQGLKNISSVSFFLTDEYFYMVQTCISKTRDLASFLLNVGLIRTFTQKTFN